MRIVSPRCYMNVRTGQHELFELSIAVALFDNAALLSARTRLRMTLNSANHDPQAHSRLTVVLRDAASGRWRSFDKPELVVVAYDTSDVVAAMARVEARVTRDRLTAAGFVSYEAAPAFDSSLSTRRDAKAPLLLFGLYRSFVESDEYPLPHSAQPHVACWRKRENDADYRGAFARIKAEIGAGNVYQINHTVRLESTDWNDDRMIAHARYGARLESDDWVVASASPELFFGLDGERLLSQPMKGTIGRGLDSVSDLAARDWLAHSAKNRAENLMITDMVRNDMGRIAQSGSVSVDKLFSIEQFPGVWQMTSSVSAKTTATVTDIFAALFPAASITGAPKQASMELINQLETSPREVYTGAIGYIAPDRKCQFNVAIRTVLSDKQSKLATFGVGGGIVWDSVETEEIREIQVKAQVLDTTKVQCSGALLETMRWEPSLGVFLEDRHLDRVMASARYYAISVERKDLHDAIARAISDLATFVHRLRLMVSRDGTIEIQAEPLVLPAAAIQKVALARFCIDRADVRLYHKSTDRSIYERASTSVSDGVEALLFNDLGEVTESVIANIVFGLRGKLYTPPLQSGLLGGTLRQQLLDDGVIQERILRIADLASIDQLYLVNALRGWREAVWIDRMSDSECLAHTSISEPTARVSG